jgi:tripartite-type tricarboxylate transporter receptor subunit TctC
MKYTVFKGTVAALALISSAALAQAQDWSPEGPVTVMIAFQAGGGADTMGRLLAQELADRNGWEMIPENVVGRGGAAMAEELGRPTGRRSRNRHIGIGGDDLQFAGRPQPELLT